MLETEPHHYRGLLISDFWWRLANGELVLNEKEWMDKRRRWQTTKAYAYHKFPWERTQDEYEYYNSDET